MVALLIFCQDEVSLQLPHLAPFLCSPKVGWGVLKRQIMQVKSYHSYR